MVARPNRGGCDKSLPDYPARPVWGRRLAVDEACFLLLVTPGRRRRLRACAVAPGEDGRLNVVGAPATARPQNKALSWTVLSALVEDVSTSVDAGQSEHHFGR